MELESYMNRYSGETRLRRLLTVAAGSNATTTVEKTDRNKALHLAEEQMKREGNALLYREIFGASNAESSWNDETRIPFDADWALERETSNKETRRILEGRLSSAQSRLHKDAIRIAYLALAEHDARTGKDNHKRLAAIVHSSSSCTTTTATINPALYRAMDYCTTRIQTAQVGLKIIEEAIHAEDYKILREYVERVESTLTSLREHTADSNTESLVEEIASKVQIAKGMEQMIAKDYRRAANTFAGLLLRSNAQALVWKTVVSPEDVATYAGLMCLVIPDRSKMLALADHPEALERVPLVKEVLLDWSRAKYKPCMQALVDGGPLCPSKADVYWTPPRWESLVQTIQETCVVEYLKPYQRVELEGLKDLLDTTDEALLLDTLLDLMDKGRLPNTTRLDCRQRILFHVDPFVPVSLAQSEERILDETHALLVRMACIEHDYVLMQQAPKGKKSHLRSRSKKIIVDSDSDDESPHQPEDAQMVDVEHSAMNPEDIY